MTKTVVADPRRATTASFDAVPSRDFDGGLLRRVTYTLTRADALAYLRLRRDWPGRAKVALAAWFIAGGVAFGLLPEGVAGPPDSARSITVFLAVMGVQFALVITALTLWQQVRAARMVPHPRRAEFEEWIDCIAGTEISSPDCVYMSPELIGQVIETPSHLFILNFETAIVVPTRAFASAEDAHATARTVQDFMRRPWPFEA